MSDELTITTSIREWHLLREVAELRETLRWRPVNEKPLKAGRYDVLRRWNKLYHDTALWTGEGWHPTDGVTIAYWRPLLPMPEEAGNG